MLYNVAGMVKASIRHTSSEPDTKTTPDFDAIVDGLKGEYLEYASNALVELEILIKADRAQDGTDLEIINAIRSSAHDLKGTGASFGFPLITQLACRMEEFFMDRQDLNGENLSDAQRFVDHLRGALEGRFDGLSEADVVQTLPAEIVK
ncbi:MAG: Hpt domain-containing protein [Alphaproteobacteria bacterium]|nr:Hpt domain-containing protein [Alphaproteobacteria bacterium]